MKALSIKQPWAHLIVHGGKDVENRTWATKHRGRFLVHASQGMTRAEHSAVVRYCADRGLPAPAAYELLQRGGIVGSVSLVDCQRASPSAWFMGDVAFVLADPQPVPFVPCKGRLGFFDVPQDVLVQLGMGGNL